MKKNTNIWLNGIMGVIVGAVTGGLAGLYYGYGRIPADWLSAIKRRDWIEGLCDLT